MEALSTADLSLNFWESRPRFLCGKFCLIFSNFFRTLICFSVLSYSRTLRYSSLWSFSRLFGSLGFRLNFLQIWRQDQSYRDTSMTGLMLFSLCMTIHRFNDWRSNPRYPAVRILLDIEGADPDGHEVDDACDSWIRYFNRLRMQGFEIW